MKIYISGPITGIENFVDQFNQAESLLNKQGHETINPALMNTILPESTTYDQYMSMSYLMLDMCDTIVMLPGWEKSKGACIEYGYAMAKDMLIIKYNDLELGDESNENIN